MPPNERNNYECEKDATGPLDRKKLIEHINKQALETPDEPELEPYIKGKVRGKKVGNLREIRMFTLLFKRSFDEE